MTAIGALQGGRGPQTHASRGYGVTAKGCGCRGLQPAGPQGLAPFWGYCSWVALLGSSLSFGFSQASGACPLIAQQAAAPCCRPPGAEAPKAPGRKSLEPPAPCSAPGAAAPMSPVWSEPCPLQPPAATAPAPPCRGVPRAVPPLASARLSHGVSHPCRLTACLSRCLSHPSPAA